ncbi:MAG: calcium/sodium antiporter [Bacteroidales bacterium]|nr:calcium/sodium antiporter [Bacteroidales bacterium]
MVLTLILFVSGFVLLIAGAHALVNGASSIGTRLKISQMIMGLTVVALGTSLPELIVNIFASFAGNSDLAIGNVLGSNITNTLLVVGTAAVIMPVSMSRQTLKRDIPFSLFVLVILFLLANDSIFGRPDSINRMDGLILLLLMGVFMYILFTNKKEDDLLKDIEVKMLSVPISILYIVGGSISLYYGGKWVVDGALVVAKGMGISETAMGLTLVSGATSLPEWVTSILAARKKNADMALGNAIGSNILNVLLVLGVTALIRPVTYSANLNIEVGLVFLSGLMLLLFAYTGKIKNQLNRLEGVLLILLYIAFIYFSVSFQ